MSPLTPSWISFLICKLRVSNKIISPISEILLLYYQDLIHQSSHPQTNLPVNTHSNFIFNSSLAVDYDN